MSGQIRQKENVVMASGLGGGKETEERGEFLGSEGGGGRVEGGGRLPLQYGLSARDGGRVKRAADAGAVSRKDGSRNRNS